MSTLAEVIEAAEAPDHLVESVGARIDPATRAALEALMHGDR